MILKTHNEGGITIAQIVEKEANLTLADGLKAEMVTIIDQQPKKVLADFSQVVYVDSSFLGALVSSLKYAVSKGSDIAVVNLPKDIHDLFSLIRLDKVFKIYASVTEALADIN